MGIVNPADFYMADADLDEFRLGEPFGTCRPPAFAAFSRWQLEISIIKCQIAFHIFAGPGRRPIMYHLLNFPGAVFAGFLSSGCFGESCLRSGCCRCRCFGQEVRAGRHYCCGRSGLVAVTGAGE